jgi:hypothetical protein
MAMEVSDKQMFVFRSVINGTPFEFGRVGANREEAATTLGNDLQKFVDELREMTKGKTKPN